MQEFGIIGLGFISERHIQAIEDTGNRLIFGCDIDERTERFLNPSVLFYTDYRDFFRYGRKIDYISIATPNYLHFPMITDFIEQFGKDINIVVEKPVCLNFDSYKQLLELEKNGQNIFITLQFRYNEKLKEFRDKIRKRSFSEVDMKILVHRGEWYFDTWKGKREQSGGIIYNIGVHYLDLLTWFFGEYRKFEMKEYERYACGTILFDKARVKWELSIQQPRDKQLRYLKINGTELDLSAGFEKMHTKCYFDVLAGKGLRVRDVEPTMKMLFDNIKPNLPG